VKTWIVVALACAGIAIATLAIADDEKDARKAQENREEVDEKAADILAELYKIQPGARAAIESAAGYAAFHNFSTKFMVAGGGSGKGVAVDSSGNRTYMRMVEVQAGLGFGVKKFKLVWVFTDASRFDEFVNSGWELGGQATASAAAAGEGGALQGALSVSDGIWLYQIAGDGLAVELTAKGTKYYKWDDLN
jgi:lipid-binding SYLF domain-containing protein